MKNRNSEARKESGRLQRVETVFIESKRSRLRLNNTNEQTLLERFPQSSLLIKLS